MTNDELVQQLKEAQALIAKQAARLAELEARLAELEQKLDGNRSGHVLNHVNHRCR